ncbi:MAG: hypothetical protein JEY99_00505 [Spirochaetales bacterium]|nr:hypothetical protein [Spirochaetales bacterium]
MILVFDFGTTHLKGALMTEDGLFKGRTRGELGVLNSDVSGFQEVDPEIWISSLKKAVAELLAGQDTNKIRGVVISGNGPTLVPMDKNGDFLNPVMIWMDRRGTAQSKRIKEISGEYLDPTFYLPKALWLHDNKPEVYNKTKHFLSCPEAIVYKLTGMATTILPGAHFEGYFWSAELLNKLGLDQSKFPAFSKPGNITGQVTRKGQTLTGIPLGLPVISAGPDFISSILGTAAVKPGRCCDRAGTSEGINLCTKELIHNPALMGYGHVVEAYYNLSGIISASGRALDWITGTLGCGQTSVATLNDPEVHRDLQKTTPGSDGLLFLPYLAGERAPLWDPAARGVFAGLGLYHGREHMIRAVLESTGFAMRDVIDTMDNSGCEVADLRITGGPAKNRMWNQIKADITRRRILVPQSVDSDLTGNLVIGLKSLGNHNDLGEASDKTVKIAEIFEPRREYQTLYEDLFELYRETYKRMKELFPRLSLSVQGREVAGTNGKN